MVYSFRSIIQQIQNFDSIGKNRLYFRATNFEKRFKWQILIEIFWGGKFTLKRDVDPNLFSKLTKIEKNEGEMKIENVNKT
jgi:hypothetical protein